MSNTNLDALIEHLSKSEITIKDIIEYLSKYPKETKVVLNHDGWMAEENKDPQTIIGEREIFSYFEEILIINN